MASGVGLSGEVADVVALGVGLSPESFVAVGVVVAVEGGATTVGVNVGTSPTVGMGVLGFSAVVSVVAVLGLSS